MKDKYFHVWDIFIPREYKNEIIKTMKGEIMYIMQMIDSNLKVKPVSTVLLKFSSHTCGPGAAHYQ